MELTHTKPQTESCCNLDDPSAAIGRLTEMICLKRKQEQWPENAAANNSPRLGRQVHQPAHIKVYSYYEIDHTKVGAGAPEQLRWTRVVMVSEKCKNRVVVRFPSVQSLCAHFSMRKVELKTLMPSLDEEYVMEREEAGEVLYRRVLPDDIGENKDLWSFWVVSKNGVCWSELKSSGMLTWGRRKKVHFLGRNEEGEEEETEEEKYEEMVKIKNQKRKRDVFNNCKKRKKKKGAKNSIDRWSKERYEMAEVNMLKILKEKGAVFGKPILRPALRTEARKLIGDTGLLDHLLKHMAGKVAPGGQERFMRRHNADGAMEYWLESSDLVNVRKEAGVQDPYWTPPPGWNPGDNPTQDPVCAREFKQLKSEMAQMRRDMQELLSKKQGDDFAVATPSSCVRTPNLEQDSFLLPLKEMYAGLMTQKTTIEQKMMEISYSIIRMEKEIEKQKSSLEEPVKPLQAASTLSLTMESAITQPLRIEKETKDVEQKRKQIVITSDDKQEDDEGGGKITTVIPPSTTKATALEDKASKIERLKSGFRICKPLGTFLWPDMAISPQAKDVVPLEDLYAFPSPPSVSSSTNAGRHVLSSLPQHGPLSSSPVKPLPERRPLTVNLTTAVTKTSHPLPLTTTAQVVKSTSTAVTITTSTKTSLINLNVVPNNQNDSGSFGFHSQRSISTSPISRTYQRHNEATTGVVPCSTPVQRKNAMSQRDQEGGKREILLECEKKQKGISSTAMGTGTWLALAPPKPPLDSNSTRG